MQMRDSTEAAAVVRLDVMLSPDEQVAPSLPLGSDGVQRWIWHSRFGQVLIEVVGEQVFVNGKAVAPHVA